MVDEKHIFELFFDPVKNDYYYVGEAYCEVCKKKIHNLLLFNVYYSKRSSGIRRYCMNCITKRPRFGIISQDIIAIVVSEVPDGCFPVFLTPPGLSSFNFTTIDLAEILLDKEVVIDRTRLACRQSWEGAQIGKEIHELDLEEKDRMILSDKEVDSFLEDLRSATPVIPCGETKKLLGGESKNEE